MIVLLVRARRGGHEPNRIAIVLVVVILLLLRGCLAID